MASFVLFSKDRPLQCEACLSSFLHHTDITPENTHVIYRADEDYVTLAGRFPSVNWWNDGGDGVSFDATWRKVIEKAVGHGDDDLVMFSVDDCVFTRKINTVNAERFMREHPEVSTYTFRLGHNITAIPKPPMTTADGVCVWRWHDAVNHWCYPFELQGSLHRGSEVHRAVAATPAFINPNEVEVHGVRNCWRNTKRMMIAMDDNVSATVNMDINRVQDLHPNPIRGGPEHSTQQLREAFRAGKKLDWMAVAGITPPDVFIGATNFHLV